MVPPSPHLLVASWKTTHFFRLDLEDPLGWVTGPKTWKQSCWPPSWWPMGMADAIICHVCFSGYAICLTQAHIAGGQKWRWIIKSPVCLSLRIRYPLLHYLIIISPSKFPLGIRPDFQTHPKMVVLIIYPGSYPIKSQLWWFCSPCLVLCSHFQACIYKDLIFDGIRPHQIWWVLISS